LVGKVDDVGNDTYGVTYASSKYYIRQKGNWAYITTEKKGLRGLPDDPLGQFDGLDKQYDLTLSVKTRHVPPQLRGVVISMFEQVLEAGLRQGVLGDNGQR